MGTRNLVSVIVDGEVRIAQYAQWDGYPTGQGKDIAEFLRTADLTEFADRVRATRFLTAPEMDARIHGAGLTTGPMDMDEAKRFAATFPAFSRDTGAEILGRVANGEVTELFDSSFFAKDHLWCEWAYYIDLDQRAVLVEHGMSSRKIRLFTFADFTAEGAMEAFEAAANDEDEVA